MESTVHSSRTASPVLRWFAPPSLLTAEDTRRARILWTVAWPFLAVVAATLAMAVALEPATLGRRVVTVTAVALLVATLHEVSRRGRTVLACWMLVVGLTLLVTQRAWITGGIHAPVEVFYALFVMTAGGLLGRRASSITGLLCFACACFLTGAEMLGLLTPPVGADPPLGSLVFVMLAIGMALVLQNVMTDQQSGTERRDGTLMLLGHDTPPEPRMTVKWATLDVSAMARGVVSAMGALRPDRSIEVTGDARVTCRCDAEILRHILETLVSNAIKHTPATGSVRLDVRTLPRRVRIAVLDEGPGIPAELRRRIFARQGVASPDMSHEDRPAGLSLALCKLAVESHGGTIRIEDVQPRGIAFVVELPR